MDADQRGRVRASQEHSLATIRRAIGMVRDVIAQNEELAQMPGHEASARRRIAEGGVELEHLLAEERRLAELLAAD